MGYAVKCGCELCPKHWKSQEEKRGLNIPPSLAEVMGYCAERQNHVDAERFWNFYESKGWAVGRQRMKNWQAAVRTWEKDAVIAAIKEQPKAQPQKRSWCKCDRYWVMDDSDICAACSDEELDKEIARTKK